MSDRNVEIDRLRAFAILITIYAHFGYVTLGESAFYTASQAYIGAANGVTLFFVISGYVISSTLLPSLDRAAGKHDVLTSFWIKRSTRILPMALTWIALPFALCVFFNSRGLSGSIEDNLPGAAAAALFYFNFFVATVPIQKSIFGHYWSLAVEEQFYLVFPFLLLAINSRYRLSCLGLVWLVAVFISAPLRIVGFEAVVLGAIVYLITQQLPAITHLGRIAGGAVTLILMATLATAQYMLGSSIPSYLQAVVLALLALLLVGLASQQRGFIPSLGRPIDAVVNWIGTRSFGLYLIHLPAFIFAGELTWRMRDYDSLRSRAIIGLVVLVVATECCYRWLEAPIRDYGRRVAQVYRSKKTFSPSIAYQPVGSS
jgi:peptidoglycan/LPS O-acetylase OafA/YrhL